MLDRRPLFRRAVDRLAWLQGQLLLVVGYWVVIGAWSVVGKLLRSDPLAIRRREPCWEPFLESRPEDAERQY